MAQIDLKYATISIKDGTAGTGQNSIDVTIGQGTLTYSEKRNMEYTLDRGTLDEVREGDEVPMDVSFDLVWEYITGTTGTGGIPSVEDALKKQGAASTWTSSDADACRPYAVDLVVTYTPNCSGSDTETITLPDFRWESIDHDIKAGTIKCAGKCNATKATAVRA